MTTADPITITKLLDELVAYLKNGGDIDDFAADQGVTVDDIADSWNTYFSPDFSREYNLDSAQTGAPQYSPQPPPHGDPQAMKEYVVQEVNNYQQFTTINNIEDNSFNQQIVAAGDVNQDIAIDNSDNIAEDGGILVRDSDGANVVTGDDNVVDAENVIDGNVTATAGEDGQAQVGIDFGGGLKQNQQDQDVDIEQTGDNTGGAGGNDDDGDAPIPVEPDGGPGGPSPIRMDETEPAYDSDNGLGPDGGGDGGDAGHDIDLDITQEAAF